MRIGIAGAGAFGTALAVALCQRHDQITLWARDAGNMQQTRTNPRLPGITLPPAIKITDDIGDIYAADTVILGLPAQTLRGFLIAHAAGLAGKALVACGKGIELGTLTGPTATISATVPDAIPAMLTGPSFAADIARGLPTALTLACEDEAHGIALQKALSTPALRLYRTTDTIGAELGGALKNVIAIACGACIGQGMGESARAALMTRGFAEMQRLAAHLGARPDTLMGLSGLGDLALTCTSEQSRNYRYGLALGRSQPFDTTTTVEGAATANAIRDLSRKIGVDMPISLAVAGLVDGDLSVTDALRSLLSRPLKEE